MTTAPTPPPDPFALLEQDHRDVDSLLEELSGAGSDDQRQEVLTRLQHALSVHFDFEESEIYPLVARLIGAPQADDRHTEDDAVREALGRLEAQPPGPPGDDGPAGPCPTSAPPSPGMSAIETELFPRLRDEVGPGEQEHLSAALLALREAARPAG